MKANLVVTRGVVGSEGADPWMSFHELTVHGPAQGSSTHRG